MNLIVDYSRPLPKWFSGELIHHHAQKGLMTVDMATMIPYRTPTKEPSEATPDPYISSHHMMESLLKTAESGNLVPCDIYTLMALLQEENWNLIPENWRGEENARKMIFFPNSISRINARYTEKIQATYKLTERKVRVVDRPESEIVRTLEERTVYSMVYCESRWVCRSMHVMRRNEFEGCFDKNCYWLFQKVKTEPA
ncbi:MAG: hypothetical protein A2928_00900 [Candidatus Taylorbacteria bacterium RIFCSPLOWO2_01_FULL_45_15b]|uniref:Uncharacterized protein n=1 Tax=Candidatus Taylorbacteria bacterium RIFCSPLOWO2_01_FULL_45_15b TaxID=1802319 RepID=A0A1G2N7W1_9BACT|nr:MAG: hypothetical protein A2928_00900 [Candidatus Taylorbacteria bacterium RIFCSPLOWO2_01_FULL_45_15b]